MKTKNTDWSGIEREYRGGQLSLRMIAKIYNISPASICRRAHRDLWERDLASEVRKAKEKIKDANSIYVKFTSTDKPRKNHFELITKTA